MDADQSTIPSGHQATVDLLRSRLGGEALTTSTFRDNLRIHIGADRLIELLSVLKLAAGFRFLSEVGGVDYLKYPTYRKGARFEVHYVLRNLETSEWLVVKVGVDDPNPTIPSVTSLWAGANWMEREVYDMYGISFSGHPDLRRILMPEEFTSHPLRKDYPLRGRGERHNFPRILRAES